MRGLIIRIKALVCGILLFVPLINYGAWIWLANKIRHKKLKIIGIVCGVATLVLWIGTLAISQNVINDNVYTLMMLLSLLLLIVPCFVIVFLGDLVRCETLYGELNVYKIRVDKIDNSIFQIEDIENLNVPEKYEKAAKRIYGDKTEDVLKAIAYAKREEELTRKQKQIQKINEEDRKKEENRRRQEEKQKAAMEVERKKAEAEIARAEAEKLRLENEKMEREKKNQEVKLKTIEAEKAKAEAEAERAKAEAETEKVKAEAEAERAKAEAETEKAKAKVEAEKARAKTAETEKLKYEAEKQQKMDKKIQNQTILKDKIDINSCSEEELSIVPGIGIILAKKAIQIRKEKGKFNSVDEFIALVGIRQGHVEYLKDSLICKSSNSEKIENTNKFGRKIDF